MTEHDDALSLDMVTAALRADSTDVAIYARVLTQSLGEALPSEFVTVDRDRTMSDRMRGRPGEISRIAVQLGDQQMTLSVRDGKTVAEDATAPSAAWSCPGRPCPSTSGLPRSPPRWSP